MNKTWPISNFTSEECSAGIGTLSYLKTRNLTSLFRFKAFLFQRVRPLVNVAPLQLGEKEGLSLISCRQAEFREQGVIARIVAQTAQHRIDQQA